MMSSMSSAVKNIKVRAVKKRLEAGENLDDIFKSYPRLTRDEIKAIEEAL